VRDACLNRPVNDIDIATSAVPDEVIDLFARTEPLGKEFGTVLVINESCRFEVTTFRQDGSYQDHRRPESILFCGPEEDALRRDFTVNALFYDPSISEVLDYVGGHRDLELQILRAVGDPQRRFREDALRILRGYRFVAQLGFDLDSQTREAMVSAAPTLQWVARERVREEFRKLIFGSNYAQALQMLSLDGIFANLRMPLDGPTKEIPQLLWDLGLKLNLPFLVLAFLYLGAGDSSFVSLWDYLKLGRAETKKLDLVTQSWRSEYSWPTRLGQLVEEVLPMEASEGLRLGHQLQLFRTAPPFAIEVILGLRQEYLDKGGEPYLSGKDLMTLASGPRLGKILREVWWAQLEGVVKNKEDALNLARTYAETF
jgi:tRNA nucleotidyltransferase/poly(A) polymerase